MITVNGTDIRDEDIARELQYHPTDSLAEAQEAAARALAVRTLLLQRAAALGIDAADDEEVVALLLAREVSVPEADETACRRFYETRTDRFRAADLFEAAHILLSAHPDDHDRRDAACRTAQTLIELLTDAPTRFAELARVHSACPSKDNNGHLGQIARGDTNPEFETFLINTEPGLCPIPVPSRHGYHVLRLDRRVLGEIQPFEAVRDAIDAYLRNAATHRAIAQYVQLLAAAAEISGINLAVADGPLVQ